MGSVPAEGSSMREQGIPHLEDTGQIERSNWVLDSPNPPPLWKKLLSSVRETILPHGNKFCFSSKKKTCLGHADSLLQSLFPILSWLRNYKASKFKDDLLAGLTLASLSIPQVFTNILLLFVKTVLKTLKHYTPPAFSFPSLSSVFSCECCRA